MSKQTRNIAKLLQKKKSDKVSKKCIRNEVYGSKKCIRNEKRKIISESRNKRGRNKMRILKKLRPENAIYKNLYNKPYEGLPVYIVGGGPSLKDFDFSVLDNYITISVNRSWEFMNNPTICFSIDTRWLNQTQGGSFGHEVKEEWKNIDTMKIMLDTAPGSRQDDIHYIKYLGRDGFSDDLEEGLNSGHNSGYSAIQLAAALGSKEIHLLGFDMGNPGPKQKHFHSGYPSSCDISVYKKNYIPYFKRYSYKIQKELGIEVINHSMESNLDMFPKKSLKSIIRGHKKPRIVCYYTDGYEEQIKRMSASVKLYGFPYDIQKIEGTGKWKENTYLKAQFIRDMLDAHPRENIVWTDADSEICSYPHLFINFKSDVGVVKIDWKQFRKTKLTPEVTSGTMYFKNNKRTRELLDEWVLRNKEITADDTGERTQ